MSESAPNPMKRDRARRDPGPDRYRELDKVVRDLASDQHPSLALEPLALG